MTSFIIFFGAGCFSKKISLLNNFLSFNKIIIIIALYGYSLNSIGMIITELRDQSKKIN